MGRGGFRIDELSEAEGAAKSAAAAIEALPALDGAVALLERWERSAKVPPCALRGAELAGFGAACASVSVTARGGGPRKWFLKHATIHITSATWHEGGGSGHGDIHVMPTSTVSMHEPETHSICVFSLNSHAVKHQHPLANLGGGEPFFPGPRLRGRQGGRLADWNGARCRAALRIAPKHACLGHGSSPARRVARPCRRASDRRDRHWRRRRAPVRARLFAGADEGLPRASFFSPAAS